MRGLGSTRAWRAMVDHTITQLAPGDDDHEQGHDETQDSTG
jgi:hypothetical protein